MGGNMNGTHTMQREDEAARLQGALEDALRQETGLHGDFAGKFAARILAGLRRTLGGASVRIPPLSAAERAALALERLP